MRKQKQTVDVAPTGAEVAVAEPTWVDKLKQKVEAARTPVLFTSWSWVDEQGLYYGDDGAWLYRAFPSWLLEEESLGLNQMLFDLVSTLGERQVHLLRYSWEQTLRAPDSLPASLEGFISSCYRAVLPESTFLLGVKVKEDPALAKKHAKIGAVVAETVDRLLLEWVPDLDVYSTDRAAIVQLLEPYQTHAPTHVELDMLEFWYTLGVAKDIELFEREDVLSLGRESIEMRSVRAVKNNPADALVPLTAGPAGSLVVSVRGRAKLSKDKTYALLTEASAVVGRRSPRSNPQTLESILRYPGVESKPLPLRQAVALNETFPCSKEKVDPYLFNVSVSDLRKLGFHQGHQGGARAGVLVGLVSPDYSYPRYCEPFSTPGNTVAVAGDNGSGKTFFSNLFAVQAALAGLNVVCLAPPGSYVGAPLLAPPVALPQTAVRCDNAFGLLDVFSFMPPEQALEAVVELITHALPQHQAQPFIDETRALLRKGVSAAGQISQLLTDTEAQVSWATFTQTTVGQALLAPSVASASGVQVWDLGAMISVFPQSAAGVIVDLLGASALYRAQNGLLVDDQALIWRKTNFCSRMWEACEKGGVHVTRLVTTSNLAELTGHLAAAHTTVLLETAAENQQVLPQVFSGTKTVWKQAVGQWLEDVKPVVTDGVISQPARGLIWEKGSVVRSIAVGPVPVDWVESLTNANAIAYQADLLYGEV